MSRRRYGSPEAAPSEPLSEQDSIPTSDQSQSTSEASPSSEQSSDHEGSDQTTQTEPEHEPQVIITFGKTGIRIVLSDDMPTVGGGQLERAYIAMMREANLQRVRAIHKTEEIDDAA